MLGAAIVWIGLGVVGAGDYLRPFGAKVFDQATFDAETFGDKKSLIRDEEGMKITLAQGQPEAGWKTPQALRIGGDCTITAALTIRKLPKPAGEDGVAIGLAVATQNIDQPDATLLRQVEKDGKNVFRAVEKAAGGNASPRPMAPNRRGMMIMPFGFGENDKPGKPVRRTSPAQGNAIRLELRREGSTLRYLVFDEIAAEPREIGHYEIGSGDLAGVKVFVSNRNGPEPVEVLFRDLTIRADRLTGLGTAVRTIFGTVLHGDPTGLDGANLVIGGPPPVPPAGAKPAGKVVAAAPMPAPGAGSAPMTSAPALVAVAPAAAAGGTVSVAEEKTVATVAPAASPVASAPTAASPPPANPAAKPADPGAQAKPGAGSPPQPPGGPTAPTKKLVPLDEVETIAFERSATLSGRFIGQPNVDTTGPGGPDAAKEQAKAREGADKDGEKAKDKTVKKADADDLAAPPPGTAPEAKVAKVEPKPNGIRDIHLSLSSLRPAALRQIMVQCPTDKGQAMWQLDNTGTENWPLTMARAGVESWADLFLEPPAGDCHEKEFQVTLNYADGQQANARIKATAHTDPKLKFDPDSPTPALDARVFLANDEQLFGKLEAIGNDNLTMTTPWGDHLDVPMTRIVGVYMGMSDHKESPEAFAKRLKARGDQDTLLARAKDGEVVAISGVVETIQANKLGFQYGGKSRTLPLKGVEGIVLASRPAAAPPAEVRPTFDLAGGLVISGRWAKIEATTWDVEAPWGQTIKLPVPDIRSVRVRGGQMTYLSDLEPSQVDETAYFGRLNPYRKDVSLSGTPLKLANQAIDKGLAVHSRSSLTYDLDRRFTTFETLIGFDESGGKKGRVDCRVFADGKEIYGNPDLRADAAPTSLKLAVAGAEQLRLVVDFGPDEDTGDRIIWGNARLYRRTEPTAIVAIPVPAPAAQPPPAAGPAPTAAPPAESAKVPAGPAPDVEKIEIKIEVAPPPPPL